MIVPLAGFVPDADPMTPGVLTDCTMLVPTERGFRAAPGEVAAAVDPLPAESRGLKVVTLLSGGKRLFAGTQTAAYELTGSTWTNRSRAGGYTGGTENRWTFTQFGNVTIGANQTDTIQAAAATAAFADIAGAPKARIVESVAGFVMAFGTVDATNGDEADRWWCSGLYNHATWTPSQATQAATGRLIDAPGEIRAGRRLGGDIVAYKERAMFLGRYVGPPVIWAWQQITGEVGAVSHEAVVSIGTAHYFMGGDDFWVFDGSRPQSIGAGIRRWFFSRANRALLYRTQGYYDRVNGTIYWYYASLASSGELDACIAYNARSGKWGVANRRAMDVLTYIETDETFDEFGAGLTYDELPALAFDSPQWLAGGETAAILTPARTIALLSGRAQASSFTTGALGSEGEVAFVSRVTPRFSQAPTSASMEHAWAESSGLPFTTAKVSTLSKGRFDTLLEARWHRLRVVMQGDAEVSAIDIDGIAAAKQ